MRRVAIVVVTGMLVGAGALIAQPAREGQPQHAGQPQRGGQQGVVGQQLVDRLFQSDSDGDGKLSKEEAAGTYVERIFETADTNGDDFIERAEVFAFIEAQRQRRGAPEEGEGGGSFHDSMEGAGRAWRGLRRSPFDATSRDDDLQAIQTLETRLLSAKGQTSGVEMSPQAEEKYGDDHAAHERDLRLALVDAISAALALEKSVIEGDTAVAKAAFEKVAGDQREGHKLFKEDEDD